MNNAYIKLCIAALLPVVTAALLYLLDKKTPLGRLKPIWQQILFGIIFGGLAIIGTEWGIPINGAQANCRDAAVLVAGLLFGAPAGIIAGVIGGVERWFAVAWGIGSFTRVACTVSTILAGVYSALLRKYMFENKRPGWLLSMAIGIVVEVFHLTMVFVTNMNESATAFAVVKSCTLPMTLANGLSVMLATVAVSLLSREHNRGKKRQARIFQTVQRWLMVTVLCAFIATTGFLFSLQHQMALSQSDSLLSIALDEITADIRDASDENLLSLTRQVRDALRNSDADIGEIARKYGLAEISIIDQTGHIMKSTDDRFVGFSMNSGPQAAEFLCLLEDQTEFVQDYGPISYDKHIRRKYAGVKTDDGFLQVGYNAAQFQKDIDSRVIGLTHNRHVGETGCIIIVDEQLNVVSAPDDFPLASMQESAEGFTYEPDETFTLVIDNDPCYCRYTAAEGYYIISILPKTEALRLRNIAVYVNTFMEVLVFAVLFAFIYLIIKRVVVSRIQEVNRSLGKITEGDLDEVVNVRSSWEFTMLSDDINATVDALKQYIAEASARIDKELEFAKAIQISVLPGIFPAFPQRTDFDIYASMRTAKEVGGDFYDFYFTHHHILNFLIADVSGKGIPAAMFMMRAKTELKSLTETGIPIDEVFARANNALCEGNDTDMFVTVWQGSIDLNTGLVRYVSAGHNPPLVRGADGQFAYRRTKPCFVMAGMEDAPYRMQEMQLEPGDIVFLYTDGVTEATDADLRQYGESRLLQAVNTCPCENMQALCDFVLADLDTFVGEAAQFDDITMLALRYNGAPAATEEA